MFRHNYYRPHPLIAKQDGFSLVELMLTISLVSIMSVFAYGAFNSSIINYFSLQRQSMNFTDLARQSHRLAGVVRGATDITTASGLR